MGSRRQFVKSVGSLSLISTLGVASANKNNDNRRGDRNRRRDQSGTQNKKDQNEGTKKSLREKISEAFQEGGFEEVDQVLENADVAYDSVTGTPSVGKGVPKSDDGMISTQDAYSEDDSIFQVLTLNAPEENTIHTFVQVILNNRNMSVGSAKYADDVIAAQWDNDHWEVVGEPYIKAADPHNGSFDSGSYKDNALVGKVNLRTGNWFGNLPEKDDNNLWVELCTKLEYIGDNMTPIYGFYEHTEAAHGLGGIKNITVEKGSISVDLSGQTWTNWSKGEFSDPEDIEGGID